LAAGIVFGHTDNSTRATRPQPNQIREIKMESQNKKILQYMRNKPITAIDALEHIGSFRLAARVKDLRDEGHEIYTEIVPTESGSRIARYSLIKEAKTQ
tara:strand:- start:299 stop:595 length:297 start_codon:yes stop_codon:yes gene_type:complete